MIVVCGGADDLAGEALARAERILAPAVAMAASLTGAALVDGGTAAAVMAVMGNARAERGNALVPLVGVAPAGKVTYPGATDGANSDRTPLETHHTHFVLATAPSFIGDLGGRDTRALARFRGR